MKKTIRLTEGQLKQLIGETIKNVLKEDTLNELFGLSNKEREQKAIKQKLEIAFSEIDKFNFKTLFKQYGRRTNEEIDRLVNFSLSDAESSLRTVKSLMPNLFDRSQGAKETVMAYNGEYIKGVVPANFSFVAGFQGMRDDENEIKNELKQKLKRIAFE